MSPLAPPRRILLCVGIGLLLNAAVTAASWITQPRIFERQRSGSLAQVVGPGRTVRAGEGIHVAYARTDYLLHGTRWSARGRPTEIDNPPPRPEGEVALAISGFRYQFGFPFRSVQFRDAAAEHYQYGPKYPAFTHAVDITAALPVWQRGLPTGLTSRRHQLLPLDPVLPGFLLNTLVYASLPALVLTAAHLRAHRRRRQSRCPACGYPIAGLPTCPECGQAVATPTPDHAHDESANRGVPTTP
jgi:hypothetical protein